MNRVYLIASANMEAKVKEVVDGVAAAGLKSAVYKPSVNGADAVKELKAHNSAVLMEKIAADFLKQDFDSVDAVVVEGAQGMSDVMAQKYNDSLATALDAKIYSDGEDADLFCPTTAIVRLKDCVLLNRTKRLYPENGIQYRLENGVYLNFINIRSEPLGLDVHDFAGLYDGAFNQIRFGGPDTIQELDEQINFGRFKGLFETK